MMHSRLFCFPILIWSFIVFVYAQQNEFIEPGTPGAAGDYTQNNVYVVGSQVQIRWQTDYPELSLVMYQDNNADFRYLPNMKFVPQTTFYRWTVDLIDYDLANGNAFFFNIFAEDGSGAQFNSHYFNVSRGNAPTSTLTTTRPDAPSSVSTSASLDIPATKTEAAATATSKDSSEATDTAEDPDTDLSTGAKAGIGVGAGVGAIGIALGVMGLWMMRRNRKQPPLTTSEGNFRRSFRNEDHSHGNGDTYYAYQDSTKLPPAVYDQQRWTNPREMSANAEAQELSASPRHD